MHRITQLTLFSFILLPRCAEPDPLTEVPELVLVADTELRCPGADGLRNGPLSYIQDADGRCISFLEGIALLSPYHELGLENVLERYPMLQRAQPMLVDLDGEVREFPPRGRRVDLDGITEVDPVDVLVSVDTSAISVSTASVTETFAALGFRGIVRFSSEGAIRMAALLHGLRTRERSSLVDARPVVVRVEVPDGVKRSAVSGTIPCPCIEDDVYDAAAGTVDGVACGATLRTAGQDLLLLERAQVSDTREGCFLGICNGPPGNFHLWVVPPSGLPLTLGSQFDGRAPPSARDTYLRGDHRSEGFCEWGGYELPRALEYERYGIWQWTGNPDEAVNLFFWEGDECAGWWIFSACNDDDAIALIPVAKRDTITHAHEYVDTEHQNFGYHRETVRVAVRTLPDCAATGAEICDGRDNDCDGEVDEDDASLGADCQPNTTAPLCALGALECLAGELRCVGYAIQTVEICDGGDNDCDGVVDESDPRVGASCGLDSGECRPGTLACGNGDVACVGASGPTPEVCGNGLDEDCDLTVDEGDCTCAEGDTRPCGINQGICTEGVITCRGGAWSHCEGAATARTEICGNQLDDDCDGSLDELPCSCAEGATRSCGVARGQCAAGTQTCVSGLWTTCAGAGLPGPEICDALDNDCDGIVDETCVCTPGATRTCGSSELGICLRGVQTCSTNGVWIEACVGAVEPTSEVCDGFDNDCDGETDEGCSCVGGQTRTCGTNVGACVEGLQHCQAGQWTACDGIAAVPETCNGLDDDCDGQSDEDFGCVCGSTRSCSNNVGICTLGIQSCSAGAWSACSGQTPVPETCNNLDDDCDGQTDDGVTNRCGTCGAEPTEVCNGRDDDCDGAIDEGVRNRCGGCGPEPAEICNGLDDDCDGHVDEGITNCGVEVVTDTFSVSNGQTTQFTLAAPAGFGQYLPLCLVDSYLPGGDDDMSYQCTVSTNGRYATFTIQVWDGGGSVQGRLFLLALGADAGATSHTFSVPNNGIATFSLPAASGTGAFTTFPEVLVYNACGDDDMEWSTGWTWLGTTPSYSVQHTGGGCAVGGRGHLVRLGHHARLIGQVEWVPNGATRSISLNANAARRSAAFATVTRHQTCGDDDMNFDAAISQSGSTHQFDLRAWNGSSCGGAQFAVFVVEY